MKKGFSEQFLSNNSGIYLNFIRNLVKNLFRLKKKASKLCYQKSKLLYRIFKNLNSLSLSEALAIFQSFTEFENNN